MCALFVYVPTIILLSCVHIFFVSIKFIYRLIAIHARSSYIREPTTFAPNQVIGG